MPLPDVRPPKTTLRDLIVAAHCRKGKAAGISKHGAYWDAESIKIRAYGGDGIGQSAADKWVFLDLRHYRNGDIAAVVEWGGRHENYNVPTHRETSEAILKATTCEEVIMALRGMNHEGDHALSSRCEDYLIASLQDLGLPEADPSPDEDPPPQQ